MATRLYLRPSTSVVSGTLPAGTQSATSPTVTASGGTTNRALSLGLGNATGTNLTVTTSAVTSAQTALLGMFVSEPLLGSGTVGGGSMILAAGEQESNLAANFWVNGLEIYVWRPSTGAKVGTVKSFGAASLGGTEPTVAAATQTTYITGIASSAVSYQDGDVIVAEVWSAFTQGMTTAYTGGLYYDGATAISSENASNTAPAAFVELNENVTFSGAGFAPTDRYIATTLSNNNRTLTGDGSTSQYESARSAVFRSTGKYYFEGKIDTTAGQGVGNHCALGLSDTSLALNTSGALTPYTGSSSTSWGLWDDLKVYNNAAVVATTTLAATAGNWVRKAIDFDAGKAWVGDATTWHNSGDPAAGTNPTFTFTPNTRLAVCSSVRASGAVTINLGTAAWNIGSPPSGFSAWYAGSSSVALTGSAVAASAGAAAATRTGALSGSAVSANAGTVAAGQPVTGSAATAGAGSIASARTVALTGSSASASAGSLASVRSQAITGQAATVSAGTAGPAASLVPTGQAVSVSVGAITAAQTTALTGSSVTGSGGVVIPSPSLALSGSQASTAAGTVTASASSGSSDVTVALAGAALSAGAGSLATARLLALTGGAATFSAGSTGISSSLSLVGAAATATAGDVTPTRVLTLTGSGAAWASGSAGVVSSPVASGASVSTAAGSLGSGAFLGVSGAQTAAHAGAVQGGFSVSVYGASAAFDHGGVCAEAAPRLQGVAVEAEAGAVKARGGDVWGNPKGRASEATNERSSVQSGERHNTQGARRDASGGGIRSNRQTATR